MSEEREKLGALWKRRSKGGTNYLKGTVNGVQVVVFHAREKHSDRSPDYVVFKSEPMKPQPQAEGSPQVTDDPF